ncbi:MAG: nucleotidyltransferase family protein [Syntrophotaleaceae bacterium]
MKEPGAGSCRQRERTTPERTLADWQFLTAWLRGEIDAPALSHRQQELLFCHHLCGLAHRPDGHGPGWEAVTRQKKNQTMFALCAQALFEKIAHRCRKRGFSILPVKGISLSLTLYASDPGRRQLSDIDLLVLPEDLPSLATVLEELGYRPKKTQMLEPGYQKHKRKAEFITQAPGLPSIDVHTAFIVKKHIARHSGMLLPTVFARARQIRGQQGQLFVLDPIDEWIYLAYHFCLHHRFAGLKWLDDLQQARLRLREGDVSLLLQRAQIAGLTPILAATMDLLGMVYGLGPQPWRQFPQRPQSRLTRIWLKDALLPSKLVRRDLEHGHGTFRDRLAASFWEFLFIEGTRQRRMALLRLLFPGKELLSTIIGQHSWRAYLLYAPLTTCTVTLMTSAFLLLSLFIVIRSPALDAN